MIIVPDLEVVVILVPRTGSGSLYRAILHRYPKAMMLYRHGESTLIPHGYAHWRRVAVIRYPVQRIWSLYKQLHKILADPNYKIHPPIREALTRSASMDFSTYLTHNDVIYPVPFVDMATGKRDPFRTQTLGLVAENRKTQVGSYFQEDALTRVYLYETEMNQLYCDMGLEMSIDRHNYTGARKRPPLSEEAQRYKNETFRADYELWNKLR